MHFKFRHLEKIVGGFFLLTCVVVVVLLVIVARGQRWFESYSAYSCFFEGGGGLKVGSPVMVKGIESGKIAGIGLGEDGRVRIDLSLFRKISPMIREGSVAKVSSPIFGSSSLEIDPGPQEMPPIPQGGTIPSARVSSTGFDSLVESATKFVRNLDDPEGDLRQTLANVNSATKKLSESFGRKDGTLRMLMERRELYDNLVASSGHLSDVLGELGDRKEDIGDSVTEARRALEEANKVILALQKSFLVRGNIERFLKEDSTLRAEGRAR